MFRQGFTCPALLEDRVVPYVYGAVTRSGRPFQAVRLGSQVSDWDQWTDPVRLEGEKSWASSLFSPTLDLAAGETVLVTVVTSWTSPTLDRFPGERPTLDPDGDTLVDTCLITAV